MRVAVATAWQTRVTPDQRQAMFDCHEAIADAARRDTIAAIAGMNRHFDASIGDLFATPRG